MNIKNFLKKQKRWTVSTYNLLKAYHSDYEEYKQWQYHNPGIKTQNAFEAKILDRLMLLKKVCHYLIPEKNLVCRKLWNYWISLMNL